MNGPNVTDATDSPREMNWKLLRPYQRGLQVAGWVVIAYWLFMVAVGIFLLVPAANLFPNRRTPWEICREEFGYLRMWLCPGLALLVLAQLIRCLTEKEYSPGRMLRNGHWVLFLYGTLLLVRFFLRAVREIQTVPSTDLWNNILVFVPFTAAPLIVKALLAFGAALILRRLVLIIEESKTLV
jgi:hypothetical protein